MRLEKLRRERQITAAEKKTPNYCYRAGFPWCKLQWQSVWKGRLWDSGGIVAVSALRGREWKEKRIGCWCLGRALRSSLDRTLILAVSLIRSVYEADTSGASEYLGKMRSERWVLCSNAKHLNTSQLRNACFICVTFGLVLFVCLFLFLFCFLFINVSMPSFILDGVWVFCIYWISFSVYE